MASVDHNYQAQVEDYHSDASEGHSIARKSSPSAQANVSTKRSTDLNLDKTPILEKVLPTNIDGRSDSGYSSYTAASKSSADSAPSTSRPQAPLPPTTAPAVSQSPAPKSRRSAGGESRQHNNESSPRQRPSRTASVSSKSRPAAGQRRPTLTQGGAEERHAPLGDPNWISLGSNAQRELPQRNRRPEMPPPTMSSRSVRDNYPSDHLSQHSDPNPYPPSSPTYVRQPAPYGAQGPAIVHAARTRRPSAAGTRPRPQSFAGDPSALYAVSGMPAPYPSPPQEQQQRGPPPAFYNNMQHMPNMQYPGMPHYGMHPVQQPGFPYPQPHQTPGSYDARPQRPELSARGSSGYAPRNYPAPVITQDADNEPNPYSARYGRQPPTPVEPQHKRLSHQMPPPKLLQYGEDEESSEEDASEGEEEEPVYDEYDAREERRRSRALMPPPKLTRSQSQRRPPLAHTKTAPAAERVERRESRRKSIVVNDPLPAREPQRERERAQRTTTDPARRPSVSRPRIHRQTQSEYVTPQARIEVNNSSRSNRRQSYQTYERDQREYAKAQQARAVEERYKEEQKRERRASKVYVQQAPRHIPGQFEDDDDTEEEDEESEEERQVPPVLRRRGTVTEERPRRKERVSEPKDIREVDAAEEYIMSTRGSYEPFADSITKAARRGQRMPALHSESGSSRSNGSGRASQSNRTTMTSNTNGEVRLRLESGQAINLQLSGEMEGRTLQLVPTQNGMTDLVIGNARGTESVYHSERGGTNSNRRSIMAPSRRDAEVISERSAPSRRPRRERDEIRDSYDDRDHVLRRTRRTNYH